MGGVEGICVSILQISLFKKILFAEGFSSLREKQPIHTALKQGTKGTCINEQYGGNKRQCKTKVLCKKKKKKTIHTHPAVFKAVPYK